jgi:hypothetical protein
VKARLLERQEYEKSQLAVRAKVQQQIAFSSQQYELTRNECNSLQCELEKLRAEISEEMATDDLRRSFLSFL